MDELLVEIATKKQRLDALRPVARDALLALQKFYDVDLTYTSNAIEGNTLTLRETAELIEHGITVGGKPLRDHLEAVDHYAAVNGRTARLLMNLLLLRAGYPPVAVRPQDRKTYLDALEQASVRDDIRPFQTFMHRHLNDTLTEYLSALQEALPPDP